jgi:hypothetical protein
MSRGRFNPQFSDTTCQICLNGVILLQPVIIDLILSILVQILNHSQALLAEPSSILSVASGPSSSLTPTQA